VSDDWKVGDLAVKTGGLCLLIPKGAIVRVAEVLHGMNEDGTRGVGLQFDGWLPPKQFAGFDARNFRKIRPDEHTPCEEEFRTLLKRRKVVA